MTLQAMNRPKELLLDISFAAIQMTGYFPDFQMLEMLHGKYQALIWRQKIKGLIEYLFHLLANALLFRCISQALLGGMMQIGFIIFQPDLSPFFDQVQGGIDADSVQPG